MVGDVAERVHARRRREDEGNEGGRAQAGAPRIGRTPVQARAERVQRQHQRRQEEAGVRVRPRETAGHEDVEGARPAGLGALEREQGERQAEERHQVGPLDETRLGRPGGQRERQRRRGGMRAAPERDPEQHRHRGEDERGLEQQRARDAARPVREREDDLEQPGQVDVAGVGLRERQEIRPRHGVVVQHDLAQAQVEEQIGLVHRDQAAARDEQQQRRAARGADRAAHGSSTA